MENLKKYRKKKTKNREKSAANKELKKKSEK